MPLTVIDNWQLTFHLSLLLKLKIFRFVLARSLENLCLQDFDYAHVSRHAVTSFVGVSSIDDRHRPFTAHVVSQLLYKTELAKPKNGPPVSWLILIIC